LARPGFLIVQFGGQLRLGVAQEVFQRAHGHRGRLPDFGHGLEGAVAQQRVVAPGQRQARQPGQDQRQTLQLHSAGGACTSSINTPSPQIGNCSLPFGWTKQMS
jgi:hypothetical protein